MGVSILNIQLYSFRFMFCRIFAVNNFVFDAFKCNSLVCSIQGVPKKVYLLK